MPEWDGDGMEMPYIELETLSTLFSLGHCCHVWNLAFMCYRTDRSQIVLSFRHFVTRVTGITVLKLHFSHNTVSDFGPHLQRGSQTLQTVLPLFIICCDLEDINSYSDEQDFCPT